jgi:hypothetical protein
MVILGIDIEDLITPEVHDLQAQFYILILFLFVLELPPI